MLYGKLDDRRAETAGLLARVPRDETTGTPQAVSERDAAAQMYSDHIIVTVRLPQDVLDQQLVFLSSACTRSKRAANSRSDSDFGASPSFRLGVLAEKFEVLAVVEDAEELLVLAGAEEIGAKPRAAADHLPKLRLRPDQLEEHEVDDLRHVDAGIEHVDGDRDVRRLVLAARNRRSASAHIRSCR